MQLIEAALAFAITMLVLSLICSSAVELIHRAFKMREAGLRYMLAQLFDHVIVKHIEPLAQQQLAAFPAAENKTLQDAYAALRESFLDRMTANRAPVGLDHDRTHAADAVSTDTKPGFQFGDIWGGRTLTDLSPNEFMERLGSTDFGAQIVAGAAAVGDQAGAAVDATLKDIAQKFDYFGQNAAVYFKGRARFISVAVALALAFFAHVDAIDLFKTYLRDPNARAKVIEQSQAVTEQYKSAQALIQTLDGDAPPANASDDAKKQVEALRKDTLAALTRAKATLDANVDLGVPLGWTETRVDAAQMAILLWRCRDTTSKQPLGWTTIWKQCDPTNAREFKDIWLQVPTAPQVYFYLILGGLLIGLGSPFWFDLVNTITNVRGVVGGGSAAPQQKAAFAAAPLVEAATAQPSTPVASFAIAHRARDAAKEPGGG